MEKKTEGIKAKVFPLAKKITRKLLSTSPECPKCGSNHVVKNGNYPALNWLWVFLVHLFPYLAVNTRVRIQRFHCKNCDSYVPSREQEKNTEIREAKKILRARLICLLRYSGGLPIRKISSILEMAFGHNCSTGYITTLCKQVNIRAKEKMVLLNDCVQKTAEMVIFDETFPRTKESSTVHLAVATDEFGLIRIVKAITNRKEELFQLLDTVFSSIKPTFFMSDYDKTYAELVRELSPEVIHCKDFFHATQTICRDARTAINRTPVKFRGKLTKGKKKEIKQLKKRLLRKRLYPILKRIFRGFRGENAQLGALYIEGGLEELKELAEQFPSLQGFYKKTAKFVHKYIDVWALQMELHFKKGLPATSNDIESKNSLFKVFRNNSKCFETRANTEEFFSAVAFMENLSIKTRGKHKGSSAVMRAGVDLEKLGGKDFFEVIGLEKIILGKKAKSSSKTGSRTISEYIDRIEKAA